MSYNSKYKGTEVEELLDTVKYEDRSKVVTTDTDQTIDGVKTFTNYVNVKRNPENDSVMHMGQNASGQGMIYIDSTTSQPMMFYNNTPNGRIQIRSLKADSMPNIELLDGQVAMTISTEDSYTGIFTSNKKGASTGLAMGTNKKGLFQIVYPETTDDMPEIASITHHGDIMLRALKSEYANENYAWLRYDPNINTLNISAFEATTEGGYPMDLDVQINGKEVAKKEDMPTKVSELENDAKYASAEDTDDVVEEPEGGGSAGGSNVYTLDIGEWDGVSNIEDIPITMEDAVELYNADSVRVRWSIEEGSYIDMYPISVSRMELDGMSFGVHLILYMEDRLCTIFCIGMPEYNYAIGELISELFVPYQPVFGVGMYDAETDSWTSLSDMNELGLGWSEVIEYNKTTYNRIKEIGYDGIVGGMVNSPLVFKYLPITFEPITMYAMIDEGTFLFVLEIDAKKNDGTISRWGVTFNEDGTETYTKYE